MENVTVLACQETISFQQNFPQQHYQRCFVQDELPEHRLSDCNG